MIITSSSNERLKFARRVRDGREPDLIFIEGERLIEECLRSKLKLIACFHAQELSQRGREILAEMADYNCPIYPTTPSALETISDTMNTQGLIAIAERPAFPPGQSLSAMSAGSGVAPLIVCLDSVQDPGNLGTIIRTAEAAGAGGVVTLKGSVDAFSPKALRSSMGSAFRLPVAPGVEREALLTEARVANLRVAATASNGETLYSDYDWRRPTMIIFGNEARGVSEDLLERCDTRLRIPLRAPVESLNVAAAAAVILFEAARQRVG
jgi:TrmH family RNA methyltransferase